MKKLFTIDDFMVAFISALGYGFGYTIPMHLGWSQLACMVSCFALGIALEELISKLVFSKTVQKKNGQPGIHFCDDLACFPDCRVCFHAFAGHVSD